jgi:signal transduction histidine kinase
MAFLQSLKLKLSLTTLLVSYLIIVCVVAIVMTAASNRASMEYVEYRNWYFNSVLEPVKEQLTSQSLSSLTKLVPNKLLGKHIISRFQPEQRDWDVDIKHIALVDENSMLMEQWGGDIYQPGDLGIQLPFVSRDDLADALVGRFNNGIEHLSSGETLVVYPIHMDEQTKWVLISKQNWQKPLVDIPPLQVFLSQPLGTLLAVSLLPLILVGIVVFIVMVYSAKTIGKYTKNFHSVTQDWASGNLNKRLPLEGPSEIVESFSHLNNMADQLQCSLKEAQQHENLKHRTQLANELHDTVKQSLFANNLTLATCQTHLKNNQLEVATELLSKGISLNQEAFQQVNNLITTTESGQTSMTETELLLQINEKVALFDFKYHLNVQLMAPMAVEVAELVVTALGEGLQNVKKHVASKLSNGEDCLVWIDCTQTQDSITLCLFNIANESSEQSRLGQGLTLLKQRTLLLRGEFCFTNTVRDNMKGIELSVSLPIEERL